MKFQGKALKDGKFWLADIPFLELMTQGRTKKELLLMVEDLIITLAHCCPKKILFIYHNSLI